MESATTASGHTPGAGARLRAALGGRWLLAFLLLETLYFAVTTEGFASLNSVQILLFYGVEIFLLAVAELFVIITGGIDLSVGYVLLFSGVCAAQVMNAGGDPTDKGVDVIGLGLIVALIAGLGWGILNGVLVAKARVPPLIVTLGTLGMSWGLAQIISGGQDIRYIPSLMATVLGAGRIVGLSWMVIVAAIVATIGTIALNLTRFGRYTKGVGSNKEAARRAGINVDGHLIKVYALSGLLAGFGGFLSLAYFTTTTISGHSNDNLNAIAAVVIGGTSLVGGVGTVVGTTIGVFIPSVLASGFIIIGMQSFWQNVAVGAVLIIAVFIDQTRRRSRGQR